MDLNMNSPIYLDNNATTKVDDRVLDAMLPYFSQNYGNASSKLHEFGWVAEAAVEKARKQVAGMIGAEPSEIIFTSGATEGANAAIKGIFKAYQNKGRHIITVSTEHKAVLDTCEYLKEYEGAEITYLNVDKEGLIDPDELRAAIKQSTILISVMAANNETGVIQPLEEIASIAREHKIIFFSDATQYAGKVQMDVNELGIDGFCLSAHKFYGPKGIGAMYLRRKDPRVNMVSLLHGGSQENHRRAGTLNVPLIVGLGKACEIAQKEMWDNNMEVSKLRAYFEHQVLEIDGLRINGSTKHRLYNTSNITFPSTVNIKALLSKFAFSSGSACASGTNEPSHVLKAMQINEEDIKNSYRFSFGKYNTLDEVKLLIRSVLSSF
jgi:cysteine desulfurase